ncbi:hypothetical protein [Pantoea stewartii]|uniref:Uncharacterized protein n=1 Tax=Pantoea stewartii subsp. stewartii DC283 TaxID=660596 RepID=H3R9R3_PANSE|nr:hypothetical protein [Pantoea stewartii]ARF51375.1 hypothetical protein DSJ_20000 [Pantoea stewartii subsp. stewartii DC283]EHU01926.1 hypothetical protein CKS_0395 [Pantoea stewartii subsp. stewartii DC283]
MKKVLLAWWRSYTPEIVTSGIICTGQMLFFHWMRDISWAGSFVLALFVFVAGAALGTLMLRLPGWHKD